MAKRIALLRRWEKAVFEADHRVKRVEAYLSDASSVVMIVRPDGRLIEDWRPMTRAFLICTVEENGLRETGMYNVSGRTGLEYYTEDRQQRMIKQVVDRALFQLRATQPPAGEFPVVLAAGPSAILLHEAIGHGMEADFNRKDISIFSSLMNQKLRMSTSPSSMMEPSKVPAGPSMWMTKAIHQNEVSWLKMGF